MQLRFRDMEWWMRRRQLPSRLRQRVRKYERERWAAVTGDEEMEMIKDLTEGLRRDIKRYFCLELVRQVMYQLRASFLLLFPKTLPVRTMRSL
jgi:cyclic nucleotide gated channel, plant